MKGERQGTLAEPKEDTMTTTNSQAVREALKSDEHFGETWYHDHLEDCNTHPLARALKALADHADRHQELEDAYNAPIGEDYVLGPPFLEAVRAIHSLLNGETGRLDCNLVSRACIALAKSAGFSGKDLL